MKTVSSVGSATERSASEKPADFGRLDDPWDQPLRASDLQLDAVGDRSGPCQTVELGLEGRGEPVGVARGLDRHDRVGADAALELGRRVEGEDLAVVHDRHPVAQLVGLLHVVRRQHDGLALAVEAFEQLPQRQPTLGVEPGSGLVEEEHRRPVEDGTGHHQPLCHAAGECVDGRLGEAGQLEPLEQVVGRLLGLLGAHAEEAAVAVQVLPRRELAVQRVLLRHHADQLLDEGRVLDDVDAADQGLPPVGMTRVVSTPTVVVLPAPFGPSRPKTSPVPDAAG